MRAAYHAVAIAVIALATLAAFFPTFYNGFVAWDDDVNLTHNLGYRGFGLENILWMFTQSHAGHYHPLTWLSFALDYQIWGMKASGYHLTGLIIHMLGAMVCYLVALSMLRIALGDSVSPGARAIGALAAALMFAVHPLRVESVAWATERRDVLSGFFYLWGVWAYLRANTRGSAHRWRWMIACFGFYVLALFSKVITVSLPAVLLVLDVYPLGRLREPEDRIERAAALAIEKLPFFAAGIGVSLIAVFAQTDVNSMLTLHEYPFADRLVQVPYSLWFYIDKTLVPTGLSTLYELPRPVSPAEPRFLWPIIFVPTLTVVLILLRRRWPSLLAAWTAHVLMLVPVCGLFQNGPQITADRYSYLSCVPFALVVGGAVARVLDRARTVVGRAAMFGGIAAGVVALGSLTWRQTEFWRDSISLWSRVVDVEPWSAFGNNNRGVHLMEAGQYDLAERHYRRSLETKPEYGKALCNLGILYARRGNQKEAIKCFRESIAAEPNFAPAHLQLGSALYKLGDIDAARDCFERAIKLDPSVPRAYNNLAAAESALHDVAAGVEVCRAGLKIAPNDVNLNRTLAWYLATARDPALRDGREAIKRAEFANRATGGQDAMCLLTVGAAYAEVGRFDDAIRVTEAAKHAALRNGNRTHAASIQQCLIRYRAHQPFRE